ncbi:BrxA family protein [Ruminiclostridium cellobioparum]|uniref:BrxA family protein n=1 Tax=Ruminiclostridium cellobioparum TaxID=29355 RepID=UPI0028A621E4|nr:BrxA family protein [Ruminiclostridium cellobioparum]
MGDCLYQANLKTVGTILPETKIILNKYLELKDLVSLKKELVENNLILKASKRRIENIFNEIKRRYLKEQLSGYSDSQLLHLLEKVKSEAVVDLVLYYHFCKEEKIVYEFITGPVHERYSQGYLGITTDESLLFLQELANENDEVGKWSERTFKDMKISLISVLRDFKFMRGSKRPVFEKIFIPSIVFYYLFYSNKDFISTEQDFFNCKDFKLFLLDKGEMKVLLDEAFRNRIIDLKQTPNGAEITYNYKDIKEIIDEYSQGKI